jgi:glucuronate isomerase
MHKNSKGWNLFNWPRFALSEMTRSEWEANGNYYDHYSWRVCPCPLISESGSDADEDDNDTWSIFNRCSWLWGTIRFGNLYWNEDLNKWFSFLSTVRILTGKKKEKKGDLIFQQPYPIEKRINKNLEKADGYFEKVIGCRQDTTNW